MFVWFLLYTCADQHQEVRDMFTQIEAFAVSSAHLTVFFYPYSEDISGYRMESIILVLQLRIRPFQDPHFYAPTLHTKGDPLIVMVDFIDSLLSDVALVAPSQSQLEELYSGLRSLKSLLRKYPHKFDDFEI